MLNTNIHPRIRKAVVLLMAFVMILTYMPTEVFAAGGDFGTHAYFRNGSQLKGSDGKAYYNDGRAYTNRWYTTQWNEETCYAQQGPRHSYTLKSKKTGESYRGYCLEQDVKNPNSGNVLYSASQLEDIKFLKQLKEGQKIGIKYALLYGAQPDTSTGDMVRLLGKSVEGCNKDDWYVATQAIIWEFQQNLRASADSIPSAERIKDGKIGTSQYKKTAPDFFYAPIKNRPAGKVYRAMLNAIREHKTVPSFTAREKTRAPLITMEKVGNIYKAVNQNYAAKPEEEKVELRKQDDYYVLTDKNNVIQEIKVVNDKGSDDKNFELKRVENGKYTLTFKGGSIDSKIVYHVKKDIREATKIDCLAWNVTDGHYQTLAFGANDPVDFFFRLTEKKVPPPLPPEGECPEKEKPELEVFPEFQFPVHKDDVNPGWDGDNCTGMGDASLGSTFVLKRDGVEVDRITLDVYGNTDVLTDKPWTIAEDIEGVESGSRVHEKTDADGNVTHSCTVTPTRCDWDDEVTYTVEELTPADGRHPVDFSTTKNIPGNTQIRATYMVKYHAESLNEQKCMDCPQYWTDMEYKIDITDADGTTTTLEGKVTDGTIETDPVHTFNEQLWINDNYRGDLQIVKTKDDLDPFTDKTNSDNGIKDYSTKSKWTIQLKSGGWEDHQYSRVIDEGVKTAAAGEYERYAHVYKVVRNTDGYAADPSHPLEVSEDGQIYVYDLPYGTYEVKEIAADSTGYVLETFEVVVNEHGQKISKAVNNQPKKNVIKVVKTNQETGKTVRWDADKTAFRIRYMGNPDYANPKDRPNYGKLLPNGYGYTDKDKDYVFYANKNGEIVLPYQIEWGMYQLEELVVPEGYFVGKYDDKGNGTIAGMGKVDIIDHKGQVVEPPMDFLEVVQVRDKDGNKVESFKGNVKTTYNVYKFNVLEQDDHVDGDDYITYYATIEMPNIPAKGKIEITKDGEELAGWNEDKTGTMPIWKAVWDKIKQANTKYEIYAAEDIMQSDGVIPIKAYNAETNEELTLDKVSRDHADIDGAKEVWEKTIESGEKILQTSAKQHFDADLNNPSSNPLYLLNKTITQYIIGALNGATYSEEFETYDEKAKMTYHYTVEYKLNYSKGGFNYTDVHVTKKSTSDDYVAEIETTEPSLKSGDLELGFVTMNYDGGNMVRMNRLDEEKDLEDEDVTGQHSAYNTDDIKATIVNPKEYEPKQAVDENGEPLFEIDEETGEPKLDENGEKIPVMTEPLKIVRPAGWTDYTKDADGEAITNAFMVEKDGEYMIFVQDGDKRRWIPCTEDQKFYLSYFQEYDFTTAQHFNCEEGFRFSWDDVMKITTDVEHETDTSTTVIEGFGGVNPLITESNVYTHETVDNVTTFYGKPEDKAPVYFKTHDGIRTEMYLSGRQTHTRITVLQSQLFVFDKTFPLITLDGEELQWNKAMDPDNSHYEYIADDQNYIKADRHEVSPDNKEAYYTLDIVSTNTYENKGFKITYPDTTTCVPIVQNNGTEAELVFESIDDTMVYPIGHPVQIIKTGLDGIATSKELPLGEYWVREVESNNGHVNAGVWKKFVLEYKDQYTPLVWDSAKYDNEAVSVKIDLEKLFETAYESKEYKLGDGAVFGIFTAEEIKAFEGTKQDVQVKNLPADSLVETLVIKDGKASSIVKLPEGRYYIREISTPEGYKLNGTKYYFDAVDVLSADDMKFHYKDLGVSGFITQNGENGVVVDFDTLYKYTTAKVSIDGRVYSMDTNYTEEGSNVAVVVNEGRTNTQVRVKDGQQTVITFENGSTMTVKSEGQTYTTTLDGPAPTYDLDPNHPQGDVNENFTVTTEGTKTIIAYSPKVTKTNWLSEVEYKFVAPKGDKTDKEDGWITIQPANKQLVLTSPEKTSAVKASVDYEYGSAELTFQKGTVTGIMVDSETVDVTDSVILKRIVRTPANEENNIPAKEEVKETNAVINFEDGVTFTVQLDKAGQFYMTASGEVSKNLDAESTLTVDGSTELPKEVNLKNTTAKTYARNNTSAGVLNIVVKAIKNDKLPGPDVPDIPDIPDIPDVPGPTPDRPSIKTTAKDSDTLDHIANADGKITIIDTVEYRNLTPGKEYLLQGILMDKETGKPIKVSGKEVTSETKFTPEKSSGKVDMSFTFDGSKLAGTATVVFEKLFVMTDTDKDGKPDTPEKEPTAKHEDIKDEGQTVYIPEIKTTATDSESNDHIANADKEVIIVDEVAYKNLIPGKEYTMSGVLMNKATGNPILVNGKKVTAEKTFTPDSANGSVNLDFKLNASALAGVTTVVFESCSMNGKEVGSHKNLKDKHQTVHFPELRTSASHTATGVITDIVTYKNLIPGKEYTVSGVLMDKETGNPVLCDGKKVTAETTFIPTKPDGKVSMNFYFREADLYGKTTVVFEKMKVNGVLVGSHEDLNDKAQTVIFETPEKPNTPKTPTGTDIPKTGDTNNIIPYLIAILCGILGITVFVASRKKDDE